MPAPLSGQAVTVGNSSPVALSSNAVNSNAFTIKAPATNQGTVWIGSSSSTGGIGGTGHAMDPGDEITYTQSTQQTTGRYELRVSDFYVCGSNSDYVTWLASPQDV